MGTPARSAADLTEQLLAAVAQFIGPVPSAFDRAVRAVPRHLFLPAVIWLRDGEGGYRPCDRAAAPGEWLSAAYSDAPLVTQLTDKVPTSSASMPSMVLRMLALADLDREAAGLRVLELGAGTGFNAALLCHLCDDQAVATVELDPTLAAEAERNLKAVGHAPKVVRGDAGAGWPAGAPYKRIIATFSVDRLPSAWLEQTEPGGRIVTPWNSAWCSGYGTLVLTTTPDGGGEGRFHDFASFMPMRELVPSATAPADNGGPPEPRHVTSSALSPWAVAGGNLNAEFHVGLTVPGAWFAWDASGEHAPARLDVADDTGPSWATVDYDGQHADRFTVTQAGPRRLWDEITAAHTRWESLGRPSVDQYGLTVDTAGAHTVWVIQSDGTREPASPERHGHSPAAAPLPG
ncbi:Protein-L-isoaspartate O-methyltransferase [Streptomyces sp. S4.7]|uniref:methyltransferase n=1 Tax=Streptomyces sp. S4.7 TaxID=2705439 RepID=UPI0013975711|nr:methyltransferase [Streptomyces sp. S4.7]QHY96288.1 Protein-L-isoaspartate O-methyltransferase [Streptomyces sp. S4.7]